jgi:hypothetical protein
LHFAGIGDILHEEAVLLGARGVEGVGDAAGENVSEMFDNRILETAPRSQYQSIIRHFEMLGIAILDIANRSALAILFIEIHALNSCFVKGNVSVLAPHWFLREGEIKHATCCTGLQND